MCALIGSFEVEKILGLIERNQHRGRVAYSLAAWDPVSGALGLIYGKGLFDPAALERIEHDGRYLLCHLQSPTHIAANGSMETQPSIIRKEKSSSYLWHNGILVPQTMEMISRKLGVKSGFDTHLLHWWLEKGETLDEVEGSFACIYLSGGDGNIRLFRSRHAKLYIDEKMTLSSERFPGSRCINADRIYRMDPVRRELKVEGRFRTRRFNINIEGELDD